MTPHASVGLCPHTTPERGTRAPRGVFQLLIYLLISTQLVGCGFFTKKPDTNALCIAECPDLTALPDDTFGSTTKALMETANTYYNCRKACQVKR